MVFIAPFVGAAVFLSGLAAALPTSDYSSSGSSNSYGGSSDSSSNSYGGSSDSSSNYGSSGSSNYGSSGSSNYGGSNYGGSSNNYDTSSSSSSTMNMDSTSTMNMNMDSSTMNMNMDSSTMNMNMDSSTMNMNMDSSTMNMDMTSTTTAYNSYQTSTYGSGSSYWGGSGYEDCVNQCVAQFGGSSGGGSYQATATSGSYGSTGTGSTHTIIVAPTQGTLRFVPFATNASVGDTLEFHWGANEHTVTKSSALTPCNKSSDAPVFASGEHNESFVFTQVVNNTDTTFYYCGTATHCEKGMFGIINPATTSPGAPTSFGGMMSSMAANDSDLSAYSAYTSNITSNNAAASSWGAEFDMSALPEWAHGVFATNVMYTRAVMGMNPDIINANNAVDLAPVAQTPLMLPNDISGALNAAAAAPASDASATPAGAAATAPAAASPSASAPPKGNGASSVASSRFLVGAVVVLATIFAL